MTVDANLVVAGDAKLRTRRIGPYKQMRRAPFPKPARAALLRVLKAIAASHLLHIARGDLPSLHQLADSSATAAEFTDAIIGCGLERASVHLCDVFGKITAHIEAQRSAASAQGAV